MNKLFKRTIIEAENSDLNLNEIVGGVTCVCDAVNSLNPCTMDCTCLTTLIHCPCNKDHGVCNAYLIPCNTVYIK